MDSAHPIQEYIVDVKRHRVEIVRSWRMCQPEGPHYKGTDRRRIVLRYSYPFIEDRRRGFQRMQKPCGSGSLCYIIHRIKALS